MPHKITLYQFEECPYCEKVRRKLKELNLDYTKINAAKAREDPLRKTLFQKSGVPTVPVIEIDGKFTGESDVIIQKLESLKE